MVQECIEVHIIYIYFINTYHLCIRKIANMYRCNYIYICALIICIYIYIRVCRVFQHVISYPSMTISCASWLIPVFLSLSSQEFAKQAPFVWFPERCCGIENGGAISKCITIYGGLHEWGSPWMGVPILVGFSIRNYPFKRLPPFMEPPFCEYTYWECGVNT
jgi:hypothetical protein